MPDRQASLVTQTPPSKRGRLKKNELPTQNSYASHKQKDKVLNGKLRPTRRSKRGQQPCNVSVSKTLVFATEHLETISLNKLNNIHPTLDAEDKNGSTPSINQQSSFVELCNDQILSTDNVDIRNPVDNILEEQTQLERNLNSHQEQKDKTSKNMVSPSKFNKSKPSRCHDQKEYSVKTASPLTPHTRRSYKERQSKTNYPRLTRSSAMTFQDSKSLFKKETNVSLPSKEFSTTTIEDSSLTVVHKSSCSSRDEISISDYDKEKCSEEEMKSHFEVTKTGMSHQTNDSMTQEKAMWTTNNDMVEKPVDGKHINNLQLPLEGLNLDTPIINSNYLNLKNADGNTVTKSTTCNENQEDEELPLYRPATKIVLLGQNGICSKQDKSLENDTEPADPDLLSNIQCIRSKKLKSKKSTRNYKNEMNKRNGSLHYYIDNDIHMNPLQKFNEKS